MRLPLRSPLARRAALAALATLAVTGSGPLAAAQAASGTAVAATALAGQGAPPAVSTQPPVPLPARRAPATAPRPVPSVPPRVSSRLAAAQLPATGGEPIFVALTGLVLLLTGVTLRAASRPRPLRRTTLRGA